MNRICWFLVSMFSAVLDPAEREAVRGDLAESGASGRAALRDVLGLIVRRQGAIWTHWQPWLTLVCLIVPLSMLLSLASKFTAGQSAIYIWLYADNLSWSLLKNAGFWYELTRVLGLVLLAYFTLACLSWTSGFVLGAASRRLARFSGVLFCLMLLFGVLLGAPLYLAYYSRYLQHVYGLRGIALNPFLSSVFYRIYPLLVQIFLVAFPSLWGMHKSMSAGPIRPVVRVVFWTAAIATLTVMLIQAPGVGLLLQLPKWQWIWQSWPLRVFRLIVYWPVLYLVVIAFQRRRLRTAAA